MIKSFTNNIYFEGGCDLLNDWAIKMHPSDKIHLIDFNRNNIIKAINFIYEQKHTQNNIYMIFCDGSFLLPIVKYIKSKSSRTVEIIIKGRVAENGASIIKENVGILRGGVIKKEVLTKSEFELFYSVLTQESMTDYCSRKKIANKTYYSIRNNVLKKMGVKKNILFLMK